MKVNILPTGKIINTRSIVIIDYKEYYRKHKKEINEKNKIYWQDYYKKNKEELKKRRSKSRKEHPERIRKEWRKSKFKRRKLGFIAINKSFNDCHAHHYDKEHVIYIPSEIHQSVIHNIYTNKGMREINQKAFEWLCTQETIK